MENRCLPPIFLPPIFLPDPQKYSGKELLLLGESAGKATQALILDGKQYIGLDDDRIAGAGAIGVWTKADSVTRFDDLRIANLDVEEGAGQ